MELQNIGSQWATFGSRLVWSRNRAGLSQQQLADKLAGRNVGYPVSRKNVAFWERIGTKEERDGQTSRFMHPDEYPEISEILGINGLWLFLYDREPDLDPLPPAEAVSALYGHPPPRSESELELYQLLRMLSNNQVESIVSIIKTFTSCNKK